MTSQAGKELKIYFDDGRIVLKNLLRPRAKIKKQIIIIIIILFLTNFLTTIYLFFKGPSPYFHHSFQLSSEAFEV
jgi:hypothetical protein